MTLLCCVIPVVVLSTRLIVLIDWFGCFGFLTYSFLLTALGISIKHS